MDTFGYRRPDVWQAPVFQKSWKQRKSHTVRIEVTGERNPNATGSRVHVDAFNVYQQPWVALSPARQLARKRLDAEAFSAARVCPGVTDTNVDLATGTLTVNGPDVDGVTVRTAITHAGYQVG